MDLTPILAHLQAVRGPFKFVGSAADLDAIGNGPVTAPACYLLPGSETAEGNRLLGAFEQRLSVRFMVVIVSSNLRDASGAGALAGLEALRSAVRSTLVAWAPDGGPGEPIEFDRGGVLRFDDGLLWWADEYRLIEYLRTS